MKSVGKLVITTPSALEILAVREFDAPCSFVLDAHTKAGVVAGAAR